jgi:uncharacterized membrane protein
MTLILLSLIVNVLVAGYMGAAIGFSLNRALPRLDEVFGSDTPARRILACLYISIAVTSIVAIASVNLRLPIIWVLFPLQILYKLLTLFLVADRRNPVPWCNLAISGLHAASLYIAWQMNE